MHPILNKSCAILLLCMPLAAYAERADRDKPMHLEADQVLVDDAQQISTFTGNVQMIQGTMVIRGDKIVVIQYPDGFKHGTAWGQTASFRQKREGLDEYVEGYGERIEYDTRAETVDFFVRARVKRDLDDVRGDFITYSQKTEIFQVNSNKPSASDTTPKRVRAVFQPKPKTGAEPKPSEPLDIAPSQNITPPEPE
ncbi:MAG: lipopolysaccharide transport periplasmic protein LptA [Gallionella sp.]|nr:lipopolysaccharide transport periplasmic protein LptA [Gallionella sp.]